MMATAEQCPDLVASHRLVELSDQLGPATCREFVGNYIAMWEGRLDRLRQAVKAADDADAMDVVLSIKISSQMAGAERLAALAMDAQHQLQLSGAATLASMLGAIAACGAETMELLLSTLN